MKVRTADQLVRFLERKLDRIEDAPGATNTLYCPICQKPIQHCQCGDGCAVCGQRKAIYAVQVCGECVELPRKEA